MPSRASWPGARRSPIGGCASSASSTASQLIRGDMTDLQSLCARARDREARRSLQPRGAELRRRLLVAAAADHPGQRHRHPQRARSHARHVPRGALLPGVDERDVRPRAATNARTRAPRSTRAAPTASPSSTRTGSPSTTARASACTPRAASCSTTSRRCAASSSSRARSPTQSRASSSAARRSFGSATSTPAATGATPRDYVEAMWLMLQQDEARRLRHRHRHHHHRARDVPDRLRMRRARLPAHVIVDPGALPARRSRRAARQPGEGAARARLVAAHPARGADSR